MEGDAIAEWVKDPVVDDNKKYAALCAETAKKTEDCNFFQYNMLYPALGCHCCSSVSETDVHENWDIYSTCQSSETEFNECYNTRALNAHNRYREQHEVPALEIDDEIAKKA